MNFKDALARVIRKKKHANEPFYLYCCMSDLCTSYEDKNKVSMLFQLDKRLNIVSGILAEGQLAVATLKAAYPAISNLLNRHSYNALIDCVAQAVGLEVEPREIIEQPIKVEHSATVTSSKTTIIRSQSNSQQASATTIGQTPSKTTTPTKPKSNQNNQTKPKPISNPTQSQQTVNKTQTKPNNNQTVTKPNNNQTKVKQSNKPKQNVTQNVPNSNQRAAQSTVTVPVATSVIEQSNTRFKLIVIAAVVAVIAILTTCLIVFRRNISWNGWQYVIGCLGGLVLSSVGGLVMYLLYDRFDFRYDVVGAVVLVVLTVLNFLTKWFVGDNYMIIFIWTCAYLIVDCIVLSICCIVGDSVWAFVDWGVCAAAIAALVCGLIFAPRNVWNSWQHVIGLFGGGTLLGAIVILLALLDNDTNYKYLIFGTIALIAVGIANWVLNALLGTQYRIIFTWLSAYEILNGAVLAYLSFCNLEDGWGVGQIFTVLVIIAGLVLGLIFF